MKLLFAFIISLFLFSASPAQAHVLHTNGSMGGILHIDPDDDPIAGQSATIFLSLKDKQPGFNLNNCQCTAVILSHGTPLFTTPLTSLSSSSGEFDTGFTYTFPQKDVYQLKVTGNPASNQAFTPFTLLYDIRVAHLKGESSPAQNFFATYWPIVLCLVIIFFFIILLRRPSKKINDAP